jgi:hypothetical protein
MTATPEETPADAASVEAPPPKKKRSKYISPKATKPPVEMSPREWARVRALWAEGGVNYRDLVEKYGRSAKTFERHFKHHGVKKGSKAKKIQEKVAERLEQEQINDAQVIAARIRETKEEHYKMASALARLSWNEILQAKKDSKPFAVALNNLKALNAAISNLKMAREERYAVLGLDKADALDPEQIPELVIRELTAEQIDKLRARDHLEVEEGGAVQRPVDPALTGDDDKDDDVVGGD